MRRRVLTLVGSAILLLSLLFGVARGLAAQPELDWLRLIGVDHPSGVAGSAGVAIGADGSVFVAGSFQGTTVDGTTGLPDYGLSSSTQALYVMKFDDSGQLLWSKSVGANTNRAFPFAIDVDPAGNVLVAGQYGGTVDFDPDAGDASRTSSHAADAFVFKWDGDGEFQWVSTAGGFTTQEVFDVASGPAGEVYASGAFITEIDFGPGVGLIDGVHDEDAFLWKIDSSGNSEWAVPIMTQEEQEAFGVGVTGDGEAVVTGVFQGTVDFDPGPGVYELTPLGTALSRDAFIAHYDGDGGLLWAAQVGSTSTDRGEAVAVDSAGNILVTGRIGGVADMDPGVGVSESDTGAYALKLDSAGTYQWHATAVRTSNVLVSGFDIAVGHEDAVLVTGQFGGQVDFDPDPVVNAYIESGTTDAFVWSLNAAGELVWVTHTGNDGSDPNSHGAGVATDGDDVIVTGTYAGSADFDPSPNILEYDGGNGSAFVWRLSQPGDADNDGISDAVDPNDSDPDNEAFDDESGTYGSIIERADLDLSVADASSVRVRARHVGTGAAVLTACSVDVEIQITAGDDVLLTCGSVIVDVLTGPVDVDLGGGVVASIHQGATVTIDEVDGLITIANDIGSTGEVAIDDNGNVTPLDPGTEATFVSNADPVCDAAAATVEVLWPANNKLVSVGVSGLTDPDGDPVLVTIDSIFQDEPTGSSPDGSGLGTALAQVRAERLGNGNGRVYHLGFSASDGAGGSCSGEVLVKVPKSQGSKGAPVDDGPLYDSTQ